MRHFTDFPSSKPKTLKDMRQYLKDHFRRLADGDGIAVRVKIRYLELTREESEACYNAIGVEFYFTDSGAEVALDSFGKQHPRFTIYQAGRSGGYFTLNNLGQSHGAEHARDEELDDSSDVRYMANVVYDFDKAVNKAIAAFVSHAMLLDSITSKILAEMES